jgi:hypothetical protein
VNNGRYLAKTASSPPTITVIAGGRPLTGASSMSTSRVRQTSATRRATTGAFVVVSIKAPPACKPARIPVEESSAASSTSLGPGSDVKTTSLSCATAQGLSAARAPREQSAAVASGRTS